MADRIDNIENVAGQQLWALATAVQEACYKAAVTAYENASIDGLCHEGAWECAVEAMRAVNFEAVIKGVVSE